MTGGNKQSKSRSKVASSKTTTPLVSRGDAGLLLTEPAHAVLARVLSVDRSEKFAESIAAAAILLRPNKQRELAILYDTLVGSYKNELPPVKEYLRSILVTQLQQRMLYARLSAQPEWRPKIGVVGAESVDAVLAQGFGVVFWLLPLEMTSLLLNMLSHSRGWNTKHLSHIQHGQSTSRLGRMIFNRRDTKVEERLISRIVMTESTTRQALQRAQSILGAGGVVSIRGIGWAKRPMYVRFFDGYAQLALGAPILARKSGAKLYTVSSIRSADSYSLVIKPLQVAEPRTLEDTGRDFISRLQAATIACPALWDVNSRQWNKGQPPDSFRL